MLITVPANPWSHKSGTAGEYGFVYFDCISLLCRYLAAPWELLLDLSSTGDATTAVATRTSSGPVQSGNHWHSRKYERDGVVHGIF